MNIQPKDIENKARKSGYDHVHLASEPGSGGNPAGPNAAVKWHGVAYGGRRDKSGKAWRGPRRATELEAAQDYCDYVNTGGVVTPATLRTAGHTGRRAATVIDEEERAALGILRDKRAQRRTGKRGYVYCITDGTAVKIGYSLKPEARVAELQTGNPRRLLLLATKPGGPNIEKALHVKYLRHNILQEWFRPTPALLSEFGLSRDDVGGKRK